MSSGSQRSFYCKQRTCAKSSAHVVRFSRIIQAFCETVPFPKSDTIVMLGSGKAEFWTGIPKSARNVMNSDELWILVLFFDCI